MSRFQVSKYEKDSIPGGQILFTHQVKFVPCIPICNVVPWSSNVGREFVCQEFFRIQRYGNCVLAKFLREGGQLIWLKIGSRASEMVWEKCSHSHLYTLYIFSQKNLWMKLSIDTWDETNNIESTSKTLNDLNHQCQKSSEKSISLYKLGSPPPNQQIPH